MLLERKHRYEHDFFFSDDVLTGFTLRFTLRKNDTVDVGELRSRFDDFVNETTMMTAGGSSASHGVRHAASKIRLLMSVILKMILGGKGLELHIILEFYINSCEPSCRFRRSSILQERNILEVAVEHPNGLQVAFIISEV